MFKIDIDLTNGYLRRPRSGTGKVGSSGSPKRIAAVDRRAFSQTLGQGQVPQLAGQGIGQQYSPVFDRAEIPDLGQQFLPADSASQNKLFRQIVTFDAIVGSAIEYWKDLAFSERVILSGIDDPAILKHYNDAIDTSGIVTQCPMLLHDFLVFGKFVFHMLYDSSLGYWTHIIPHDLDYVTIQPSIIPSEDPLIDLKPTADQRKLATSRDPRVVDQRSRLDPELIKFMASGKQIPLAPENTMFLPRRAFATDNIGTSYLTRVLIFKVYESAIYNASVAAARRRAGPLMHITAWENALDHELDQLMNLFFAAEEDPVSAKVVTKAGVEVNQIGGGSADYWKFSDEWPFLVEGKMRALGVSETLLTGEANWNSMETIRTVFIEKLQSLRSFFTKKIIIDKMCKQLAETHDYTKKKTASLSHHYRIAAPKRRVESELILPTVEWNRPLTPTKDQEYLDLIKSLSEENFPIPLRMIAQAAGVDLDKVMQGWKTDLADRKRVYHFKRVLAQLQEQMGISPEGNYEGGEAGAEVGGPGEEFGFEEFGPAPEEPGAGGFEMEAPAEEPAAGPEAPAPEAPGAPAEEGPAASTTIKRFPIPKSHKLPTQRIVATSKEDQSYRVLGNRSVIDLLGEIPVWDDTDAVFGVPKKYVAKLLHEIAQTNPSYRARTALAMKFYDRLRKTGLSDLQAQTIEYLAARVGYIPKSELTQDVCQILTRLVLDKVNGSGLTGPIKDELIALSRISNNQETKPLLHKRESLKKLILASPDSDLPHNQVLTGFLRPGDLR